MSLRGFSLGEQKMIEKGDFCDEIHRGQTTFMIKKISKNHAKNMSWRETFFYV